MSCIGMVRGSCGGSGGFCGWLLVVMMFLFLFLFRGLGAVQPYCFMHRRELAFVSLCFAVSTSLGWIGVHGIYFWCGYDDLFLRSSFYWRGFGVLSYTILTATHFIIAGTVYFLLPSIKNRTTRLTCMLIPLS